MQTKHYFLKRLTKLSEGTKFFQASLKLFKIVYITELLISSSKTCTKYFVLFCFTNEVFLLLCLSAKKKPCSLLTVYFLLIIVLFSVTPNHLILSLPKKEHDEARIKGTRTLCLAKILIMCNRIFSRANKDYFHACFFFLYSSFRCLHIP